MEARPELLTLVLRIGIVLYPAYFILDWFVYPSRKYEMLAIRLVEAALLFVAQAVYPKVAPRLRIVVRLMGFSAAALGISLMCLLSGQGYASPYTVGVLQILMVSTFFVEMRKGEYAAVVGIMVGQHFGLLLLGPWSLVWFLVNVFGLGVFAAVAVIAHAYLLDLAGENKVLKGILPICARCKKIRDDEGYWNDVAAYVTAHADVLFSHGLCPDCARELYPELADELPATGAGQSPAEDR